VCRARAPALGYRYVSHYARFFLPCRNMNPFVLGLIKRMPVVGDMLAAFERKGGDMREEDKVNRRPGRQGRRYSSNNLRDF
jgi:hypothetical protein